MRGENIMKRFPKTIALLLVMSLLASAGCNIVHETPTQDTVETTTSAIEEITTTTTTEATTTTTSEAEDTSEDTDETSASSSDVAAKADGLPDSGKIRDNKFYDLFMSFIDGFEEDYPGSTYGFFVDYDKDVDGPFWVLLILASDSTRKSYCADGDKLIEYDTGFWKDYAVPEKMLSYKTVKSLPALFDTRDPYLTIEKSIKDGYYYGDNIAYSEDGKYFLFTYGKGSYIKIEDAKKLKSGDKVTFEGSGETFMVDEGTSGLESTFEGEEFWLDDVYLPEEMQGKYMQLYGASDIPEYKYLGTALLPISEEVEIYDGFKMLYSAEDIEEYKKTHGETGNPFLDSAYYIGSTFTNDEYTLRSNGFATGMALLQPIVVKDGKIVRINLSWT
jgi:hypothetical protein